MSLPDNLIPVPGRTYTVPADQSPTATQDCGGWAAFRLSGFVTSQSCSCQSQPFIKSSADCLDYAIDFTDWLGNTGDAINTVSVSFPDAQGLSYDLTALWDQIYSDTVVVVMLASGPPRTRQSVVVEITTEQGRTKAATFVVRISNATVATDPPDNLIPTNALSLNGIYLTDDSGAYLIP